MIIRPFKTRDATALSEIFHASVHVIGSRNYSTQQVNAWSPHPVSEEAFVARVSDGRSVYVAVDENYKPIGFIELENDGHIDCFYCDPSVVGTGVGSALYDHLEKAAFALELDRLDVAASEAAKPFFRGKGFHLVRRQNVERNGVPLHNYLMEKHL
ncbi:MAG: GNAT family N-acetyltransferase [Pseudomonadota bacterium]